MDHKSDRFTESGAVVQAWIEPVTYRPIYDDDENDKEPQDTQGLVRTFKQPSSRQRNWHKKDKGGPLPEWATDIGYIMTIAANWYGVRWCTPGTKDCQRFQCLLEAICQH